MIAWEERVADSAAMAFGEGFYGFLGEQLHLGNRAARLEQAYDAAAALFTARGFRKGNPNPRRENNRIVSDFDGEFFKIDESRAAGAIGSRAQASTVPGIASESTSRVRLAARPWTTRSRAAGTVRLPLASCAYDEPTRKRPSVETHARWSYRRRDRNPGQGQRMCWRAERDARAALARGGRHTVREQRRTCAAAFDARSTLRVFAVTLRAPCISALGAS